jgi:hypothetical protein
MHVARDVGVRAVLWQHHVPNNNAVRVADVHADVPHEDAVVLYDGSFPIPVGES